MIDLHLHLDGSLPQKTVLELAEMQNIKLPEVDELKKLLTVPGSCESLRDYLKCFDLPLSLLQGAEYVKKAAFDLCLKLKSLGLCYAEIRFAPQLHTKNGDTMEEITLAAINGVKESGFFANIILCMMRGASESANRETVMLAAKYYGNGVCALDLAGDEAGYKTSNYSSLFKLAGELSVPFTIHAGEAAGPESVWEAVNLGAKRIGHGIKSASDSALMETLKEKGIFLELCPTSNFQTKASEIKDYPYLKFIEKGIKITVNSDNMTVSDTDAVREITLLRALYGMDAETEKMLIRNAIEAAFLFDEQKAELKRVCGV